MSPRALIVEDVPFMVDALRDILDSLLHESEAAGDMKTARERLAATSFDYVILDLSIPVAPGKLANRDVGRQLLKEIRSRPQTDQLPVLVLTGADRGEAGFIQSVMRAGGYDLPLLSYLQKNDFDPDAVSLKIAELLYGRPGITPPAPPQKPTTAFSAQTRRMTIYRRRVDICNVKVWGETESRDMRMALVALNRRDAEGRYIPIPGPELIPDRNASNKIGGPIRHFRANAAKRLLAGRDLECGPKDIIGSRQHTGYFLQPWIEVEVIDADGPNDPASSIRTTASPNAILIPAIMPPDSTSPTPADQSSTFPLSRRQRTILALMTAAPISQKELLARIDASKATINRDLGPMRKAGLFTLGIDNQYRLTDVGRACLGGTVSRLHETGLNGRETE